MAVLSDYFVAEPAIVQRLQDQVTGLVKIDALAELEDVPEKQQATPAAYVVYTGDRIAETSNDRRGAIVRQTFIVVLAVRNVAGGGQGDELRELAGPLLVQIIQAVQGFTPSEHHRPLQRIQGPRPLYRKGGFAYFPIAFEAQLMTTA